MENRNCGNFLGLSETIIDKYTEDLKGEIQGKKASKVWGIRGIRFYECPLTAITADTWEIIKLVYLIQGGQALLHAGGWGAQPFWLIEALNVFNRENMEDQKNGDKRKDSSRPRGKR